MNITINSQILAQELRLLTKIVPTKATIPVLNNVLLTADADLSLSVTDLDVAMTGTVAAHVETPGAITLPGKRLLDLVEQLPDGDVQLIEDKGKVHIHAGAFQSRLQTLPVEEFPPLPTPEDPGVTLSGLRVLIDRTSYAISDKAEKYVLNGALLSLKANTLALVATDGKRLSLTTAPGPDGEFSVILPTKTLEVLAQGSEPSLVFSFTDRHLFFAAGSRLLVSRMIDGRFPNYDRVIPKDCDKQALVERAVLAACAAPRRGRGRGERGRAVRV